jgi:hypothetical protein
MGRSANVDDGADGGERDVGEEVVAGAGVVEGTGLFIAFNDGLLDAKA